MLISPLSFSQYDVDNLVSVLHGYHSIAVNISMDYAEARDICSALQCGVDCHISVSHCHLAIAVDITRQSQVTYIETSSLGEEGVIMTFDVTAAEDFGTAGGQIVLTDILSNAQETTTSDIIELYSPDVVANVTNGTATGVNGINANIYGNAEGIYNLNGMRTDRLQKGVNIIKQSGKTIKVIKK